MTVQTLIAAALAHAAQSRGNHRAIAGDPTRTYADFYERTARLADAVGRRYATEARIAVLALNSIEHLEAWFAIPSAGAVLTDLNYRLSPDELAFVIDDSECEALLVDIEHAEIGQQLLKRCPTLREVIHVGGRDVSDGVLYEELLASGTATPLPTAAAEDRLAGIFYTGGTTGRAKGVMLSHGNLVANAKHVLGVLPYDSSSCYLHAAPMFHLADGSQTVAATWVGASHAILSRFDPSAITRTIREVGVTHTLLVPTMINMLVQHLKSEDDRLTELEVLMYGASPMAPTLLREAMETLPVRWFQLYGMTEAAPLVTTLSDTDHQKGVTEAEAEHLLLSAGRPVPGVEVRIRDEDGHDVPIGTTGEVTTRGPNMFTGYWNRDEETAVAFHPEGWYRTGDAGYLDDGYLYVVDRVKDMVITGGENVYSAEVERVLHAHAAVLEAAVIGVPSAEWGEKVHAVVVTKPGHQMDSRALIDHCRTSLAGYKVPRSIEMREEPLPKSGAGKILKRELRASHWDGHERNV